MVNPALCLISWENTGVLKLTIKEKEEGMQVWVCRPLQFRGEFGRGRKDDS